MIKSMVLVALLLMLIVWVVTAEETPAAYISRLDQELKFTQQRLDDVRLFAEHDAGGLAYIVRGEQDIQLCWQVLRAYRLGHVDKKHVEQFFRQLRKDMADYPVK